MPRFYVNETLAAPGTCTLPESSAHHAVNVLRLRAGDDATVFNGRGGEYRARVARVARSGVALELLEHLAIEREAPIRVKLVQGVSGADKMEFTIRKAVELGVAEVQPVLAAASVARPKGERAASRQEHWQRIAISACEQCGRNRIPRVHALLALEVYREDDSGMKVLLSPRATERFSRACAAVRDALTLAAGPEAGFTESEEALFERSGFVAARLGPRVLRTETAALAALAALNALAGDF